MTPEPVAEPTRVPTDWIDEQVDFILSKQLPSGAILSTGTKITPYFANIVALGLLYASASSTHVFYAPGVAQLWPIVFGVVAPSDPKAVSGWSQFSSPYGWFLLGRLLGSGP